MARKEQKTDGRAKDMRRVLRKKLSLNEEFDPNEKYSLVDYIQHPKTTSTELDMLKEVLEAKHAKTHEDFFKFITPAGDEPNKDDARYWYLGKLHAMYPAGVIRNIYIRQHNEEGDHTPDSELFKQDVKKAYNLFILKVEISSFEDKILEILHQSANCGIFYTKLCDYILGLKDSNYYTFTKEKLNGLICSLIYAQELTPAQIAEFTVGYLDQLKVKFRKSANRSNETLVKEMTEIATVFDTWRKQKIKFTSDNVKDCLHKFIFGYDKESVPHYIHRFMQIQYFRKMLYDLNQVHPGVSTIQACLLDYQNKVGITCEVDWEMLHGLKLGTFKAVFYDACERAIVFKKEEQS